MASLTGQLIKDSYLGLIKTDDNAGLTGTVKTLTDGDGNALPMSASTSGIDFSGAIDFSAATVTGLPGGGGFVGVTDTTVVTETTISTDLIFHSVLIPANTFTAGDVVSFKALLGIDASNGNFIYWSAWVGTNPTAVNSDYVFGGGALNNGIPNSAAFTKYLYIHTADGSGAGTSWSSDTSAVENTLADGSSQYFDSAVRAVNWTVDQYIKFGCFIVNSGNSVTHYGTMVKKEN